MFSLDHNSLDALSGAWALLKDAAVLTAIAFAAVALWALL